MRTPETITKKSEPLANSHVECAILKLDPSAFVKPSKAAALTDILTATSWETMSRKLLLSSRLTEAVR